MDIVFAAISPHAPIFLPDVGSEPDRKQVKKTVENLELLGKNLKEARPDAIIISSPHPDWGFNVPLHFIASDFKDRTEKVLIGLESPRFYYEQAQKAYAKHNVSDIKYKVAIIASGDLSHVLKEDGPYGFQPDGPKFDRALIQALEKKDIETILKLDDLYPEAGECGLRSICFMLGIMDAARTNWKAKVLSYEGPFGVGYAVVGFKLK